MRLATYNIWNSPAGMPLRLAQIVNEIVNQNVDIVCLQEVSDIKTQEELAIQCKYLYSCFYPQAGLLVLSRLPIEGSLELPYALAVRVTQNQKSLILINVHLPWDSIIKQENAIVEIIEKTRQIQTDYMFILGDFNNSENSSVYRFLKNEQSLQGCETYFLDLELNYSMLLSVLHIGSFLLSSIHNVKEKIKYAIPDIYFYYACHLSLVQ